ncbi:hypothetical protein FIV37_30405 [Pseudomonas gessardii]|nr:hypothetical protein [Pseudomonas gessardii]
MIEYTQGSARNTKALDISRMCNGCLDTSMHPRCSGLMKPDTHLGENARQIEVSDDQTTPLLYS